ncbi:hypothetical protein AOLI_G00075090 [Acnodon oligacanthus]
MIDIKAWAEYVVEWAAKDPYGFLTTVILALTPLFIASALLSWKLAKMIEARDQGSIHVFPCLIRPHSQLCQSPVQLSQGRGETGLNSSLIKCLESVVWAD